MEEEVYAKAPKNRNNEGALKRREEETEAEMQWRDDELGGNLEQGQVSQKFQASQKYFYITIYICLRSYPNSWETCKL